LSLTNWKSAVTFSLTLRICVKVNDKRIDHSFIPCTELSTLDSTGNGFQTTIS